MNVTLRILIVLLAATLACSRLTLPADPTPTPALATPASHISPSAPPSQPPAATHTAAPSATLSPSPTPAPSLTPADTAGPTATAEGDYRLSAENVRFQPGPGLYSGDRVSVEVMADNAPPGWRDAPVTLHIGSTETPALAVATFRPFGIGGRAQATFTWVWDTTGLVGPQDVILIVEPAADGQSPAPPQVLTLTVNLLPADARPMPEREARWARAESDCCIFHYLTGTAVERDMEVILSQSDAAFRHVENILGVNRRQKVVFTMLSRLLGHGGFASGEISLTYMDRNPASSSLFTLFVHEGTHILDRQFAQHRPIMMTEGLAVFTAGGHFKTEDLERRAAALLAWQGYIPLAELADNFYPSQHEIGYLQAGAFTRYLVERFGWERFKAMYASFQSAPTESQMLDASLRLHFGYTLAELEHDWLEQLRALPYDQDEVDDLRLTVLLFDTLRAYQRQYDPSAYFLHAWLPNGPEGRRLDVIGDFMRHPRAPENLALETMMAAAGSAMLAGDYSHADALLTAVNAALAAGSLAVDSLAQDYLHIVDETLAAGYEPQRIVLDGSAAQVTAIRDWPHRETLALERAPGGWRFAAAAAAPIHLSDGIILRRLFSARQLAE